MSLTNEQIIEAIASKSVTEIVELIAAMEEKFGVSAAAALTAAINLAKRDEMAGKNIVVILPDSIERYLSDPYFNDEQVESQD